MIQSEARELLWRWHEVLIGIVFVVSGAYWFLNSFGLLKWICLALMSLGILLIFVGQQRSSFRFVRGDSGLGRIVEGQIIFLVQYKVVISRFQISLG